MDGRNRTGRRALAWPVARAVGFLVVMLVLFSTFRELGIWYPRQMVDYDVTAALCAASIGVGRRLPGPLLAVVAVVVGFPYWSFGVGEVRAIPLALAAYLASAGGVRASIALPVAGVAALSSQFPGLLVTPFVDWRYIVLNNDLSTRLLVFGIVVAAVLLGRASWTQARDAEVLRARNVELQRLREADRERIANEERTAIAREIHDVVAHHVAAIVIRAQAAARVAGQRPDEPLAAVEWIAQSGQEALGAMRGVVRVLRGAESGGTVEAPVVLADAVDDVVERVRQAGLVVVTDVDVPVGLSALQQFAVLRVCQEALTNVLIHSDAQAALVRFGPVGEDVVLVVEDDGGTAPDTVRAGVLGSGGAGLRGMHERAEAVGGRVAAGPTGHGWRVELVVPVPGPVLVPVPGSASRPVAGPPQAEPLAGTERTR